MEGINADTDSVEQCKIIDEGEGQSESEMEKERKRSGENGNERATDKMKSTLCEWTGNQIRFKRETLNAKEKYVLYLKPNDKSKKYEQQKK